MKLLKIENDIPEFKPANNRINKLLAKKGRNHELNLEVHLFQAAIASLNISDMSLVEIDKRKFRISAFIGGLFHDVGKAAIGFQEMLQIEEIKKWPRDGGGYRHEILSAAIFFYNLFRLEKWKNNYEFFRAVFFSILTHHKPIKRLNSSQMKYLPEIQLFGTPIFEIMYNELFTNAELLNEMWQSLIQSINEDRWGKIILKEGWIPTKIIIPKYDDISQYFKQMNNIIQGYQQGRVIPHFVSQYNDSKFLTFLSTFRATIISGDHTSSGSIYNLIPTPALNQYEILKGDYTLRTFQEKAKTCTNNIMLVAPTGSGKTEAALYWAATNQMCELGDGKIFYVLPFSASINAMVNRLHKLLNVKSGIVGAHHAKSAEFFYSLIEQDIANQNSDPNTANNIKEEIRRNYERPWKEMKIKTNYSPNFTDFFQKQASTKNTIKKKSRIFQQNLAAKQLSSLNREIFYPIKVSTPHQILKGLLQGKGWESIVTDFHHALFIFDEIHAYKPYLVGLILGMIQTLIREFNSKILIMSATFPKFLRNIIQAKIPTEFSKMIKPHSDLDKDILENKRHNLIVSNLKISDFIRQYNWKEIGDKKVLVICNTVNTAQQIYDIIIKTMDETKVLLFHSRFKQGDRNKIEKLIISNEEKYYSVVVSTQVVEVSLDIDFDIGICEVAPIESLIQRFGRINRKGKKDISETNLWVVKNEEISEFVYVSTLMETSFNLLLKMTNTLLSEKDLVDLVDVLYQIHPWKKEEMADFERAFKLTSKYFTKNSIPGSYRKWLDDVLDKQLKFEGILEEDIPDYEQKKKYDYIGARKLLIKVRQSKYNPLDFSRKDLPPIIPSKFFHYDCKRGLTKIRNYIIKK